MSFPNPNEQTEYTHPNGINYRWNPTLNAWEIKYESAQNTASLPLAIDFDDVVPAGHSLANDVDPEFFDNQQDFNAWAIASLLKVDGMSRVTTSEDVPDEPELRMLWYRPSTGKLYIYHADGDSSQWVEVLGGGELAGRTTGEIEFYNVNSSGNDFNYENAPARLKFKTDWGEGAPDVNKIVYLYQPGQTEKINCTGYLSAKALYGSALWGTDSDGGEVFPPNVGFTSTDGRLRYQGIQIATWNQNGMFYKGDILYSQHVTTKEYVDNKFDFSQYPELTP